MTIKSLSAKLLKFIRVGGFCESRNFKFACRRSKICRQTWKHQKQTSPLARRRVHVDNGSSCIFECRRSSLIRLSAECQGTFVSQSPQHWTREIEPTAVGAKLITIPRLIFATLLITLSVKLCLIYLHSFMNYSQTRGIYGNKLENSKTNTLETFS